MYCALEKVVFFQICSCMGACLAPLAFSMTWQLSESLGAALLSAIFIVFGKLKTQVI